MMSPPMNVADQKDELRRRVRAARVAQSDKETLSQRICQKLAQLPEFAAAQVIMLYVDVRSEVRTRWLTEHCTKQGKQIVVPYCDGDELVPVLIRGLDELSPGAFGIREPTPAVRECSDRLIEPEEIDLICLPGVAFDRSGGRLGNGKGYYDRLLPKLRPGAIKVALAYECQVVPRVPTDSHDVKVDLVITEAD